MTKISYKDRELGQYYYCVHSSGRPHYIFQCNDTKGTNFPSISKEEEGDWGEIDMESSFREDWEASSDKELRLATPEEILLLQEAEKVSGEKWLINIIENYQIY